MIVMACAYPKEIGSVVSVYTDTKGKPLNPPAKARIMGEATYEDYIVQEGVPKHSKELLAFHGVHYYYFAHGD